MRPRGTFVGLATLDVVHRVPRLAGRDEKVTATRQDVAAGGPATGAAVTFAALGGRATLVTVLGASPAAALVRAELAERGVEVVDVAPATAVPLPVSAVQVDETTGERTVTSADAAAHAVELDPAGRRALTGALDGADVVLVDGHHPALAVAAARGARAGGPQEALLLLDAGRWRPVMAELLPAVDVAVCSADLRTPGAADAEATARAVLAAGARAVATTRGADPVLWRDATGAGAVAVPAVRARDTLGAGDALHGACAWALASGLSLSEALRLAVRVASHRVTVVGPRAWLADLPRVLRDDRGHGTR